MDVLLAHPYGVAMAAGFGSAVVLELLSRSWKDPGFVSTVFFGVALVLQAVVAAFILALTFSGRVLAVWPGLWFGQWVLLGLLTFCSGYGVRSFFAYVLRSSRSRSYNYPHFMYEYYVPEPCPAETRAGTRIVDVSVLDLDGEERSLSALYSQGPIVIEFGSISCPIFTSRLQAMDVLAEEYADHARFFVMYTREAHPGARFPPIEHVEQKIDHARALTKRGARRSVLVDDVDGALHRRYGGFPNSILIVGTDGVITLRMEWNEPHLVRRHLDRLLENGGVGAGLDAVQIDGNIVEPPPYVAMRDLARAGWSSLADFLVEAPRLVLPHVLSKFDRGDEPPTP